MNETTIRSDSHRPLTLSSKQLVYSHLPLTLSLALLALLLDSDEFKILNYFRMPIVTPEYNLSKIEGHIKKEDTFYQETVSSR